MTGGYGICGLVHHHSESGDVLVERAHLPADTEAGDMLATPVTGADGYSMGSNYNKISRPPAIFTVKGSPPNHSCRLLPPGLLNSYDFPFLSL